MYQLLFGALFLLSSCLHALEQQPLVFAVIGDYGNDSTAEAKVAEVVKKHHPQFIITLGDNNYPAGCWSYIDKHIGQYYHRYIGHYQGSYGKGSEINRFFPTLGNHDWMAKNKCLHHGNLPYLEYFSLPGNGRYYQFKQGPVHFYALDSDYREPDGNTKGSIQYKWLTDQMKQSKEAFNIVFFHHPPYSSGHHGPTPEMRWNFAELGADVVMAGHEHLYERIERDGIVYILNGLGGAKIYEQKQTDPDSKKFYNNYHGFVLVKAYDKKMVMQFINIKNKVRDERVIVTARTS